MPAFDVVRRWKGRVALDRDGHRLGSVLEVYYDAENDEPGWALLDLEQADGKTSLVPLADATELSVGIQFPFGLAVVRRAGGCGHTTRPPCTATTTSSTPARPWSTSTSWRTASRTASTPSRSATRRTGC
jgi:hypothetical protein